MAAAVVVVIDQSKTIDMTQLKNTPPYEIAKAALLMSATLSYQELISRMQKQHQSMAS